MSKTIYDLELHENIQEIGLDITRVPGGWIYRVWDYANPTFVPYSEEFLPRNPEHIGIAEDKPTNIKAGD